MSLPSFPGIEKFLQQQKGARLDANNHTDYSYVRLDIFYRDEGSTCEHSATGSTLYRALRRASQIAMGDRDNSLSGENLSNRPRDPLDAILRDARFSLTAAKYQATDLIHTELTMTQPGELKEGESAEICLVGVTKPTFGEGYNIIRSLQMPEWFKEAVILGANVMSLTGRKNFKPAAYWPLAYR